MKKDRILRILRLFVPSILQVVVLGLLVATAIIAYQAGSRHGGGHAGQAVAPMGTEVHAGHDHQAHAASASSEPELLGFACAMNCLPPLEEPGECPICGMVMQPVFEDPEDDEPGTEAADVSPRTLRLSPEAVALASVRTDVVRRVAPTRETRLVGTLEVDPRRRAHISANVGGRIDKLTAQFEGDTVVVGQELVEFYSPELLAVQRELLQAVENARRTPGPMNEATVEAGRERLVLAGLLPEQVEDLARDGVAREQVTLKAPFAGTVITRYVEEGDYVNRESRILTVADLGVLWAELEAFESDLPWIRPGQRVTLGSNALGDRSFDGEVTWIDPTARAETRTTRVRVDVENAEGLLRPGMFVTAIVESAPGEGEQLVIPASAPLITGRRAVVYVMREDTNRPTFVGREVALGPRVREGYVVLDGLAEGERVVTNGAFQIDSALQIRARPSMMNPEGGVAMTGHEHHGAPGGGEAEDSQPTASRSRSGLSPAFVGHYLAIHEALAADDFAAATAEWEKMHDHMDQASDGHLMREVMAGLDPVNIGMLRAAFSPLSNGVVLSLRERGNPTTQSLGVIHCPMAFNDRGADWVQVGTEVRNPYFGAAMPRCGEIRQEVAPR